MVARTTMDIMKDIQQPDNNKSNYIREIRIKHQLKNSLFLA
jgi:hypothetical protein